MNIVSNCIGLVGYIGGRIVKIFHRVIECCCKRKSELGVGQSSSDFTKRAGIENKPLRGRIIRIEDDRSSGVNEVASSLRILCRPIIESTAEDWECEKIFLTLISLLEHENLEVRPLGVVFIRDLMIHKPKKLDSKTATLLLDRFAKFLNAPNLANEHKKQEIQILILELIPVIIEGRTIELEVLNILCLSIIALGKRDNLPVETTLIARILLKICYMNIEHTEEFLESEIDYFISISNEEAGMALKACNHLYSRVSEVQKQKIEIFKSNRGC